MTILNIIKDIEESNKYTPKVLFEKLLTERLDNSLVSYYKDIESKVNHIEYKLDKKLKRF